MKIQWNKVTWYSKLAAVIIFVGTFCLAFYLGRLYEAANYYHAWQPQQTPGGYDVPEGVIDRAPGNW